MSHQTQWDKKQTAFLFQEESVDVHPYLHTLPRKEFADPEIQLMLVVFEDALRCLDKYALASDRKSKALFHETENWVFSTNDDWVFSFSSVCEALGFNPQYIRKAVLQWNTSKLKTQRTALQRSF